mgnify:CR=1 FL=1
MFCENWRDLGGKVWVDKRVLLKHMGSYVFEAAAQEKLYQDLVLQAQQNAQPQATQAQQVVTPNPHAVATPPEPVAAKKTAGKRKAKG